MSAFRANAVWMNRCARRAADAVRASVPVAVVAIAALVLWHLAVVWFAMPPILLPDPLQVARAGWEHAGVLWDATLLTGTAALAGLAASTVVGTAIAVLFSQSRHLRTAFFPYVIFLQTVPIVAIAPLLITWSGYTFRTVVYITIIISLFPIISNVTAGLLAVDRNLHDLFRTYRARRWATVMRLRIPTAVPYLVLGIRTSAGLAVVGAIIGDFFVGSGARYDGLGTLMTAWGARQKTDAVIAALFASAVLGIVFFAGVNLLAALLLKHWLHESR